MRSSRLLKFYSDLLSFLELTNDEKIKKTLRNSTNNNRVVSVHQVINFLRKRGKSTKNTHLISLANKLNTIYNTTEIKHILRQRRTYLTSRTDAVDINEFKVAFVKAALFGNKNIINSLQKSLDK